MLATLTPTFSYATDSPVSQKLLPLPCLLF